MAKVSKPADGDAAEHVLATASRLFYAHGVRAVGVEWIVADSGVAKTTLYRHFATKDDLVAAFLEREDREFWQQWDDVVRPVAGDPMDELVAILNWVGQRVSRDGYRGCPQINVAAEFSDANHPARKIRKAHKVEMYARLRSLVARLKLRKPDEVAMQIALLIDGAFTSDGRLTPSSAPRILTNAARALINAERPTGRRPGAGS